MKKIILILTALLLFTGCNEGETEQQESSIYGTWQLIEQWLGNVGDTSVNWTDVSSGYTITFYENNAYSSTSSPTCPSNTLNSGSYSLNIVDNNNFVTISLDCNENNSGVFNMEYLYSFDSDYLILSPTFRCAEGCGLKFKKYNLENKH